MGRSNIGTRHPVSYLFSYGRKMPEEPCRPKDRPKTIKSASQRFFCRQVTDKLCNMVSSEQRNWRGTPAMQNASVISKQNVIERRRIC